MLQISLVLLIVMAVITVQTQKLRNAVIFMGVFSLCISFVYLLYNAPDVAIAEAIIGCTMATILYVVALGKYKFFTIYFHIEKGVIDDGHYAKKKYEKLIRGLEVFCAKNELEPQIIFTREDLNYIRRHYKYGVIIVESKDKRCFYGHPENFKMDVLEEYLKGADWMDKSYELIRS